LQTNDLFLACNIQFMYEYYAINVNVSLISSDK